MSPSVLILDDDAAFRALVRPALEAQGLEVFEASKGREALRMLREQMPDVLIVDGLLPDTNGMRWVEGLRRASVTVPIVFVSAFFRDLDSYKRLKQDLGCADVVYKPVSPTDLARRVARLAPQTRTRIRVPSELDLDVTLVDAMDRDGTPAVERGVERGDGRGVERGVEHEDERGVEVERGDGRRVERLSEEISLDDVFDDVTAADPPADATALDVVPPALRARYAEELPSRLRRAVLACQRVRRHPEVARDLHEAISAVHELAGSAPSFGFARVGEASALLERALRGIDARHAPDWSSFDRALAVLASDRTELVAGVAAALPEASVATLAPPLPAAHGATGATRVAPLSSRLLGPRLLIVDDDPALGEYIASALSESLALFCHASSFDALGLEQMVDTSRVDVRARDALVDLDAIDGAFVASPFRCDSGTSRVIAHLRQRRPGLPVAILGLEDTWSARREAMAAGADLFIAHPVDDRALHRALARIEGLQPGELRVDCFGTAGLSAALGALGVRARDLSDPSALLTAFTQDHPHAVALGGTEALALLRAIRMADGGDEVALLATSGSGAEALEAGADAILPLGSARAAVVRALAARVAARRKATPDRASGLPRRASLARILSARLSETRRRARPFTLAVFELRAPPSAPRVAAITQLLATRFRMEDARGLWLDGFFVAGFAETTAEPIAAAVDRFREEVAQLVVDGQRGLDVGAGLASAPADGDDLRSLMCVAEARLDAS